MNGHFNGYTCEVPVHHSQYRSQADEPAAGAGGVYGIAYTLAGVLEMGTLCHLMEMTIKSQPPSRHRRT